MGPLAFLPIVMDHMEKQRAQREAAKQQQADILQRSASQLGAPSTAGVDAAQFSRRQGEEGRGQFRDLIMQLARGYGG